MTNAETGGSDEAIHLVTIDWTRGKWAQSKGKYSREHLWHLGGGAKLKASDSPDVIRQSLVTYRIVLMCCQYV